MTTTSLRPTADELLQDLFAPIIRDERGERLRRIERAFADLRRCIETSRADDTSATPTAVLLHALPCFLEAAEWQGDDDEDRRVRMRIALELAGRVRRQPDVAGLDLAAASARLDSAWRSALDRLRDEQARRPCS